MTRFRLPGAGVAVYDLPHATVAVRHPSHGGVVPVVVDVLVAVFGAVVRSAVSLRVSELNVRQGQNFYLLS